MKAVIVGDNLIPSAMIVSRCEPLQKLGFTIEALDWMWADRNEMNRHNLNVEMYGPEAEPPPVGIMDRVVDADLLIVHFSPVPRSVVEAGRRLKVIGVARAGWENIAVEAATQCGIPVVHVVGRNANAVAEYTIGLILCEMRNMARAHCAMKAGVWYTRQVDPHRCFELSGKTVGLVGLGAIGRLIVRRLRGFDVRILAYDPLLSDEAIQAAGAESASLEALLRQSDVVSLHARLSAETQGLIGARELALMKPTAYLVNTARAGLIDQMAVIEALQRRQIAGAAFDVFWDEPIPLDSPLRHLDNVTLSPHLAGTTIEALYHSIDLVMEEVLQFLQCGKSDRIVNPEVFAQSLRKGRENG